MIIYRKESERENIYGLLVSVSIASHHTIVQTNYVYVVVSIARAKQEIVVVLRKLGKDMGYALLDGTCVSSMINKEYTVNGYRFITQFDNGWIAIRFLDDVPTNCINQFSNIGAFNDYIEYLKRKPHHDDYVAMATSTEEYNG